MVRNFRVCPVTDIMCPNPACYWQCERSAPPSAFVPMIDWEQQNKDAQMILRLAQIMFRRSHSKVVEWENMPSNIMDIWIGESRRILEEIGALPR